MAPSRPKSPVYAGRFSTAQAERLLWRAGMGPRPGEAAALAERGLQAAVLSLTRPQGADTLIGPEPKTDKGEAIAPYDAWGHDHLWWFDRMIRTSQPLRERMSLVWHDWFATSQGGVGDQRLMMAQNDLFRRNFAGSFRVLLLEVTKDPAMLIWLSGNQNTKWAPNENYARELMELFTLGADARYTEKDVRQHARALTGWGSEWKNGRNTAFRFHKDRFDRGAKRIFGRRGSFDWKDSCMLCLRHRDHAEFFVRKLWGYFIPTPPPAATLRALKSLYLSKKYAIRPVLEAILMHPDLYEGPRMVKPPTVHFAGLIRARGGAMDSSSWTWIADQAGQKLFSPPNVSGWRDDAWLDTGTYRGRWVGVGQVTKRETLNPGDGATKAAYAAAESPADAVAKAVEYWGNPEITQATREQLVAFATKCDTLADREWKKVQYRIMRQNALRRLVATSPDLSTC